MKVLVVEDELLIGMDLVAMLEEWGYAASGPHQSAEAASEAIEDEVPDLAILDVNLGQGKTSMPVAERLKAAGTPFLFLSGYERSRYDRERTLAEAPHLRKPVTERALRGILAEIALSDE